MVKRESEERLAGRVGQVKVDEEVRHLLWSGLERRKTVWVEIGQCQ